MRKAECVRENELLDALQASRWPEACEAGLREHVHACASCTELLAVAAALLEDQAALVREATVPSSAIVWWRAQMRSRQEAAARAMQPISFVQGVALACAAGLLATTLGLFVPTFRRSLSWITDAAGAWSGLQLPVPVDPLAHPIVLAGVAAFGLCLLVLPVAIYFISRED